MEEENYRETGTKGDKKGETLEQYKVNANQGGRIWICTVYFYATISIRIILTAITQW